jgi:hypothetical protein
MNYKNDILVEKRDFYDIISFFNFLDNFNILFELGDLPEGYIWCNAPYNSIDVIIDIYHKDSDIKLLSYPCYGVYRSMNSLVNDYDETLTIGKNKYVIPIVPANLYDSIYNNISNIACDMKYFVYIYKKIKKEILCWYKNADTTLLEYINDDIIKLSVILKIGKINIDADMQIDL